MEVQYGVVLGAPRSGTTFLMDFMDAVPTAECVTGNLLPIVIPHLVNQDLPQPAYDALLGCFRKSLNDYLESGMYRSRSAALRKWFAARNGVGNLMEAAKGKRRETQVIYKEPFLAFAPEYSFTAIPEAQVVYIYRDGRDVANSLVRSYDILSDEKLKHLQTTEMPIGRKYDERYIPWWVEEGQEEEFLRATPYVRAIWMWKEMVRRCNEYFTSPEVKNSGRLYVIQYEQLVQDPLTYGSAIVQHLKGEVTPSTRKRLSSAHAKSIGTYKRRDPAEVREAERIAGAELQTLGYM